MGHPHFARILNLWAIQVEAFALLVTSKLVFVVYSWVSYHLEAELHWRVVNNGVRKFRFKGVSKQFCKFPGETESAVFFLCYCLHYL